MAKRTAACKKRKALAKRLQNMVDKARTLIYTHEFHDDKPNFVIKRKDTKFGYTLRVDVTPFSFRTIKEITDDEDV